jgi:hypothetical protein
MIELHNTKYFVINFDEENELFHYVFHKTTEQMTSEEYVNELKIFIDLVKEHKPKKVLGDMIDFGFSITPEIQEWVNANLFQVYKEINFKKIAILLSKGFIESLSIEQTMEEDTTNSFETSYFNDEETALRWLIA